MPVDKEKAIYGGQRHRHCRCRGTHKTYFIVR